MSTTTVPRGLKQAVDELGKVQAAIATLREKEEQLKEKLVKSGKDAVEGKLFRVTVSRFEVKQIDYKGLVEKLAPPPILFRRFISYDERVRVNVTGR